MTDLFYVMLGFVSFVLFSAILAVLFRPRKRRKPPGEALSDGAGAAQFADQEHAERMRAAGRR